MQGKGERPTAFVPAPVVCPRALQRLRGHVDLISARDCDLKFIPLNTSMTD